MTAGGRHRRTKQADLAIHAGALRRQVRELIPATHFLPLSYWLQARQTLSAQSTPTLTSLQERSAAAGGRGVAENCRLRQSQLAGHAADHAEPGADPALLNKVFVLRVARAETLAIPQEEPVARRTWSAAVAAGAGRGCPAPCAVAPAVAQQPPAAFTAPFMPNAAVFPSVFRPDNNLAAK